MVRKTQNTGIVIAGLLLSILMASMDNSITATAMGSIIGELGGLDKFVWVTSAYMVAEMAGMPIFGKLSDMYGRKRFFVFGVICFMVGSALCGTADSILQLSLYRAVQGIGAGALVPIAFTIMFDAVPPESRGKLGGLFGAVFGLSSIFGPLLGAYITDHIGWNWIFYINLPLGLIAFAMIAFFYKESAQHDRQVIDWTGAASLVGTIVCLVFAMELGGKTFAWDSAEIIGLFAGSAALALLFVWAERRAAEPIISFAMFRSRLYATSNALAMLSGAAFITASVYIPIYMQGVLGGSATNSGMVLLPMMLGTVVTATLGGSLLNKLSYRTILIPNVVILVAGIALLTTLTADTPRWIVTVYMVLVGLGVGATFSVLGNAAIHALPANKRGSASSTLNFLRSLGMTLGITVFGIIQSHAMARKLSDALGAGSLGGDAAADGTAATAGDTGAGSLGGAAASGGGSAGPDSLGGLNLSDPHALMEPAARAHIPHDLLAKVTDGLSSSISATFMWSLIPAVLALAAALLMSRERMDPAAEAEAYAAQH
ncbi:drug resistance transporter, EmrB/QacA subfamily [Cohnella sp. OV330]|uniref:MDR family MFS transporter n=1 Tax=Cohnella sp. OV330 TaxID=1855288 RepID=UPI0008EAB8CD|nr:MDR family MFS transporter [Cohnella sp. OV330]SFB09036.1 drug resistance transporter, EmrB/QacA subfamily [Cohnella sp. OV330]